MFTTLKQTKGNYNIVFKKKQTKEKLILIRIKKKQQNNMYKIKENMKMKLMLQTK